MKLIPKIRRETVDLPPVSDNWRYRGHGEALVFRWLNVVKIVGKVDKYTPGVRRG